MGVGGQVGVVNTEAPGPPGSGSRAGLEPGQMSEGSMGVKTEEPLSTSNSLEKFRQKRSK